MSENEIYEVTNILYDLITCNTNLRDWAREALNVSSYVFDENNVEISKTYIEEEVYRTKSMSKYMHIIITLPSGENIRISHGCQDHRATWILLGFTKYRRNQARDSQRFLQKVIQSLSPSNSIHNYHLACTSWDFYRDADDANIINWRLTVEADVRIIG